MPPNNAAPSTPPPSAEDLRENIVLGRLILNGNPKGCTREHLIEYWQQRGFVVEFDFGHEIYMRRCD